MNIKCWKAKQLYLAALYFDKSVFGEVISLQIGLSSRKTRITLSRSSLFANSLFENSHIHENVCMTQYQYLKHFGGNLQAFMKQPKMRCLTHVIPSGPMHSDFSSHTLNKCSSHVLFIATYFTFCPSFWWFCCLQ